MLEHPPKSSGLDAVRGIMALVVCVGHGLTIIVPPLGQVQNVAAIAARGAVVTFFVISGYVISLSVQQNALRHGAFSPGQYASSRFFRIVPPLLACYALMALLWLIAVGLGATHGPAGLLANGTEYRMDLRTLAISLASVASRGSLTAGLNDPLWTLQHEIQLYVLAGLLIMRHRIAALAYAALCFRPVADGHMTPQLVFYLAFAAGWAMQRLRPDAAVRYAAGAVAAIICAGLFFSVPLGRGLSADNTLMVGQVFYAVAFAASVPEVGRWRSRFQRTGDYSYTLYIIHFPIFLLVAFTWRDRDLATSFALAAVCVIGVTWLASALGKLIERPSEQRKAIRALLA